ncbi:TPA: hypothetical protein MIR05_19880, partial [Klebsiella pneumoniae]|nr:hypothetical protein [Klebsiella pneumoniae]
MTAEIVVINNTGIALAADSAVTTEHNRLIKINNSAEKLFELSKHHPVGIMVYNNAALGGAPWELIIKSYRKQLGTEKFGTVNDYVHDFLHYINKNEDLITPSMRQSCVINLVIDNIKGLMQHINSNNIVNYLTLNPGTNINNNIFQSIVKQQIDNEINALRNNPFFEGFDERDLGEIITYISDVIKPLIPSVIVLDNFESLEEDLIDKIILYSSYLICKVHTSRTYSGIVITGYGDNEFYPSINTLHVFGIYKDRIMFRYVEDKTH